MEPIIVNYTLAETNEPCITNNTEKLNNSKFLIFKKESKVRNKEFNYEKLLDICEEKETNGYYDIVEK